MKQKIKKILKRAAVVMAGLFLLFVIVLYFAVRGRVVLTSPVATPFFEDFQGRYISEGWGSDSLKGYWQLKGPIPARVKAAFLAIEDKRFHEHSGIDWKAIGRAVYFNLSGGPRHGGSTIAMQVARMQGGRRSLWSKMCEIVTAYFLTKKYGRETVLRQYLRLVPQGNRIHGASYAARRYFRKPLQDLGWAEAALLAALPKAPGKMNLFNSKGFQRASERAKIVLTLLFHQDVIDASEYRVGLRHLKRLKPPVREERPFHSYHAIRCLEGALRAKGVTTFSRPVRTGLDLNLQQYLTRTAMDAMGKYRPLGAGNISIMVVERATGRVRGYLGSEYYFDEKYSGAIDYARVPRSAGSTLKPFIYALGLSERKFRASSVLADLPFHLVHAGGQYLVYNYDSEFLGPVLYRKALANSRNVPAVQVLREVGVDRAHGFFRKIGLERSGNEASYYGLGLAIGGLYVTLTDLVRGYGVLANDGKDFSLEWFEREQRGEGRGERGEKEKNKPPTEWFSSQKFLRGPGAVFSKRAPGGRRQLLSSKVARMVGLFLSDPLARLPSFGRMGELEYAFPVAVKTGTSQGFRDAWAVAWSRKYIVGVWMGHPGNDRMNHVNGSSSAGILKRVMEHLHPGESKGLGEEPFPLPVGFRAVKVCSHSGQLATGLCSDVLLEYFKEGAGPVSRCGVHRRFLVDRRTGLQADRFTAPGEAELRTFWCLGPEYSAWASARGLEKPPVERQRFPEARVEISNPVNRGRMVLDPETPRSFQTLALKAKVEPRVSRIVWIIDGNVHKPVSYPYVFHWPLEPGEHTFQARFPNANVVSDVVSVTVSEY